MTLIYGHDEAEARMKRDNMEPTRRVSINHNFYSETPEAHHKKHKHKEKHAEGDSVGRQKKAMGMAAKIRRHYPMT